NPCNVAVISELTIAPEIRASRPTTSVNDFVFLLFWSQVPKAAVNFTTSSGVRFSSTFPPMVPRIPEILLINGIEIYKFNWRAPGLMMQIYGKLNRWQNVDKKLTLKAVSGR